MVLLVPLFLVVALAILLSSRGPVLFHQRRIGRGGHPFDLLKFRTMRVNTDADTTWSVENDSRITAVGRFLRRTSLDELPQLVNVVRGEMAIVGPRPERPYFVDRFETEVPNYGYRHRVRPGITGWAQVHGLRGDTSISERVRFDNQYIETWSLPLDVVILALTVVATVRDLLPQPSEPRRRLRRSHPEALAEPTPNGESARDAAGVLPPIAADANPSSPVSAA
jgi:lipopolysaccharide/colanic/teichoic acid biosynthesis glycosyltransferase